MAPFSNYYRLTGLLLLFALLGCGTGDSQSDGSQVHPAATKARLVYYAMPG